jgi:predicted methyltransferase
MSIRAVLLLCPILLAACEKAPEKSPFPDPARPVAPIVSARYSNEDARDSVGEFETVVKLAGVAPGMSVADIGAGEGYYTVRLAPLVGEKGRVLAQDIVPETRDDLARRVQRSEASGALVRPHIPHPHVS